MLATLLPLLILSVFSLLTIKNIRTVRQVASRLERQITRVLLLQTVLAGCCLLPQCTYTVLVFQYDRVTISSPAFSLQIFAGDDYRQQNTVACLDGASHRDSRGAFVLSCAVFWYAKSSLNRKAWSSFVTWRFLSVSARLRTGASEATRQHLFL